MKPSIRSVFLSGMIIAGLLGCHSNHDHSSPQTSDPTQTPGTTKDFSRFGDFETARFPDSGLSDDQYVVYYPKNAVTHDMPVIIFLEGGGAQLHIDDYRGIMEFMASQGYYVIGTEQGESYDSADGARIVQRAIDAAMEQHGLTLNEIAVMGHSQGGGQAFYVMKYLQEQGFGSEGSLTLSVDGWFSFSMNKADLRALQGDVAFIQMNGLDGTGTDPRIDLTIWNLTPQTRRHFFILPENEHGYIEGDVSNKRDIRHLIGAALYDTFTGKQDGYHSIPAENKTTYEAIKQALKPTDEYRDGDCAGIQYNARKTMLDNNDIDYCNFEGS